MNRFNRYVRGGVVVRESVAGIPATTDPNAAVNTVKETSVGGSGQYCENIVFVSTQERALRIATYYRCMELRANTMAQLTVEYQRLNHEGGNYVENDYGDNARLNYLFQREPNPLMSAFDFWRQVEIAIVARGNAFVYMDWGGREWPDAFWLATSGSYDPFRDVYVLNYNDIDGPRTIEAKREDVLHFPNTFRWPGGYMGLSTLQFAAQMLSLSATLDSAAMDTAAKGGRMKLLISEEKPSSAQGTLAFGMFNKGEVEKYASEVQTRLYNNDVVALRGLEKVQNISMSAQDMQLFDQRQFGVAEICRVMGVPRTLAMDGSNSSYKTPEADRLDFLMNCIQPKRRLIEDELNRKLLTAEDFGKRRIHLCELPLMMFDKKGQAEIDEMNLRTGTMTVNEIRKQYDMPSVSGGDTVYLSTNLAELGSEKLKRPGGDAPGTAAVEPGVEAPGTTAGARELRGAKSPRQQTKGTENGNEGGGE